MGLYLARLISALENFTGGGPPARILMLGLDAAGKADTECSRLNFIILKKGYESAINFHWFPIVMKQSGTIS